MSLKRHRGNHRECFTCPLMATVLLIDDDPDIRAILRLRFQSIGWHVVEACTGQEALESAIRYPPDLFILDWMMPGLTGLQILRELREHAQTAPIPVIVLTGVDHPSLESDAKALKVIAILQKPLDFADIVQAIQTNLPT